MPVYIVQAGTDGPVKIGWCKELPEKRISTLQTGCPETLEILYVFDSGKRYFEGYLHKKFQHLRVRGEWFVYGKEIADFIREDLGLQKRIYRSQIERKERDRDLAEQEEQRRYEEKEQEKYEAEQYEKYLTEGYEEYLRQQEEESCQQE